MLILISVFCIDKVDRCEEVLLVFFGRDALSEDIVGDTNERTIATK